MKTTGVFLLILSKLRQTTTILAVKISNFNPAGKNHKLKSRHRKKCIQVI